MQTLSLVTAAVCWPSSSAVTLGIITALRQYSALDYGVTFMAFLFFSLPIFWVAVLLKEYGAIQFNNFLKTPDIPVPIVLLIALLVGLVAVAVAGGTWKRRGIAFGGAFVATSLVLLYVSADRLVPHSRSGPDCDRHSSGVGIAFGVTTLTAGLKNRKALYSALIAVAVGLVAVLRGPAAAELGHAHHDRAAGRCHHPGRPG